MLGILEIKEKKAKKERLTMVTAYDYYMAKLVQETGIDTILVGDSLGNVFQGEETTLKVTVEEIIYHTKAVRRGANNTFIIADMPYMSYHLNPEQAKSNAARLIIEADAHAVKLEGGSDSRIKVIEAIVDCEIPVVGHLGLTPQSINKIGGYKVQGKDEADAEIIIEQAQSIQQAGAFMLVLEAVPEQLAKTITEMLNIPVIGIGAGRYTDGQVLVINDILGLTDIRAKFAHVYQDIGEIAKTALTNYNDDVKSGLFPKKKNIYYPVD